MRVRQNAFWGLTICLGLALPSALLHAESDMASEAQSPSLRLKQQIFTDDEIADRCQASIRARYDMIDMESPDGSVHRVPRCVARYEAMRGAAADYLAQEDSATREIVSAISGCAENPSQAACLDAGKALTAKAAGLQESLAQTAVAASNRLAVVGDKSR